MRNVHSRFLSADQKRRLLSFLHQQRRRRFCIFNESKQWYLPELHECFSFLHICLKFLICSFLFDFQDSERLKTILLWRNNANLYFGVTFSLPLLCLPAFQSCNCHVVISQTTSKTRTKVRAARAAPLVFLIKTIVLYTELWRCHCSYVD